VQPNLKGVAIQNVPSRCEACKCLFGSVYGLVGLICGLVGLICGLVGCKEMDVTQIDCCVKIAV
jgi:hypothetical protein